jgi:pimeloyl-ACP methyl ester carboxylesterase
MPYAETDDGVKLYFEDTGTGYPILFVHEFGGDYRSWEPQVRFFSRRYRCITFNARGYPPSDVPTDLDMYSQDRATDDIAAVMRHLMLEDAHIVGLSMGGFAALHFGLRYAEMATSLVVAAVGYGAEKQFEDYFKKVSLEVALQFEAQGSEAFAPTYARAASRIPFSIKDPRGWAEFAAQLAEHSALGMTNTMRGVQARRPSIYDLEDRLQAIPVPVLIVVGDEDDHCLQPGIFMKRAIPASGLEVLAKTGHTINLEEPDRFNRALGEFFAMVETGHWLPRDPRSSPGEIMKTE